MSNRQLLDVLVIGVEFGDIYRSFESNSANPGAIFQIPEDALPILGGSEKISTVSRPTVDTGVGSVFVPIDQMRM